MPCRKAHGERYSDWQPSSRSAAAAKKGPTSCGKSTVRCSKPCPFSAEELMTSVLLLRDGLVRGFLRKTAQLQFQRNKPNKGDRLKQNRIPVGFLSKCCPPAIRLNGERLETSGMEER